MSLSHRLALALICIVFLVAGILRLNELSLYTPDSARYLIWGNSLAHGHGILDYTLPVPDRFVVHMPLFAAILAPIEMLFPSSFVAAKVWTLVWGLISVLLFYLWLAR